MKGTTLSMKFSNEVVVKTKATVTSKNSNGHPTDQNDSTNNTTTDQNSSTITNNQQSMMQENTTNKETSPYSNYTTDEKRGNHQNRNLTQLNSPLHLEKTNSSSQHHSHASLNTRQSSGSSDSPHTCITPPTNLNSTEKSSSHCSTNKAVHKSRRYYSQNTNTTYSPIYPSNSTLTNLAKFTKSLAISVLLAVGVIAVIQANLSDRTNQINGAGGGSGRYVRSAKDHSDPVAFTRVSNGVLEIYRTYVLPMYSDAMQSIFSSSSEHALPKNAKLRYIPSSAFDPTKTAHHVLEGAGYRLNIPSYVQSVPADQEKTDKSEKVQNRQIKNDDFDIAITNKQITKPRSFIKQYNTPASNEKGIVQQAIYNPNDVPLSQIDAPLDEIIKDMLVTRPDNSGRPITTNSNDQNPNSNNFNIVKRHNASEIFNKNINEQECKASRDIVFAKTHKTGGTTVTNMLLRHAEKEQLKVALPVEYHWELAGYPAEFDPKLITPKQENYDVMCHHMRFDKSKIEQLVKPTADYFTILRDPVTNFESSFGFFKDYPFNDWLDNNRNIDDFINNAENLYNKSTPWYFRAKNYMSFDLGFNHEDNSNDYIRHVISQMENNFKFVMITDRYEESMVLLKNMLCLEYDDIVYLPLKVRTDSDRKSISKQSVIKIKQWNRLDTAIYEYFSQRFEQLTVEYGKEKLAKEVQVLREKIKDVEARCVEDYDSQSLKPWIKRIKLRKPSGQKCQRLVWGEVKYADYLRQLQYSQLSEEEYNDQPKLDEKIEYMQRTQDKVLGINQKR